MKFTRILATAVITTCFAATAAFASPDVAGSTNTAGFNEEVSVSKTEKMEKEQKDRDPVKMLQNKKEEVQQMLKEGKIDKQKADEINSKIDTKIKKIQEFNALPLQQKKEKLIRNLKESVEKKVTEGKLDRAKADEIIKKHTESIQKWDGNGYPMFFEKDSHSHKKHHCDKKDDN